MTQIRRGLEVLLVVVCLLTAVRLANGQATNTGTVVGQVTDQSGAVIGGAAITLTDVSSSTTLKTATNDQGQYVFTTVPPGTYTITVTKTGFSAARIIGQPVNVGTQTTVDIKLSVGTATQTVEVQAIGTELQTLNSTVGSTIPSEAISSLPSLNHDVNTFAELQPGVSPDGSVAGAVVDQSTFLLDGGNNSNDMDGSMSVYTSSFAGDPTGVASANGLLANGPTGVMPTPADSVQEFKVNTANQTADFDNSSGAQIELVTPRGTNRWHGGAYEYYLDNNFSGNTWDNNVSGTAEPSYHYSRFGFKAGGPITPSFWGGKSYLFGFFEGYRFPQSGTYEVPVPSANMRSGIVSLNGNTYNLKAMDPRGIGINPAVSAMWSKYEPAGNDPSCSLILGQYCDGTNMIGFKSNVSVPTTSNDLVFRVDHEFGSKWQWFASYRYFKEPNTTADQVDVGGFFSGDKLGTATAVSKRPQQPWYFVTGLTTSISSNTTNDFHYSFLRNYWQWGDNNAPPQLGGLGGALEPMGESTIGAAIGSLPVALSPYNVNTQSIRTRFWDGLDNFFSDNVSMLKGNHLLQFGGQYQRNFNYHQRSDNGGGINFTPVYQLGDSSGSGLVDMSALQAQGYPATTAASRIAAAVYGVVTDAQVAYTRSGNNLALNPPLTHAFDKSTIPFYNAYFSDTWHMKPQFTLTFGLGYTLEMPPTEQSGKQTVLVDASDEPIVTQDYLAQRKAAAEQGRVYNPQVGFALVHNVGNGYKYPYNPFYGSFSPRVGMAWNPHFSPDSMFGHILGEQASVIRGGYGRIYGRLNGVDLVLVPLLGVGLIQAVQCRQPFANGSCGPANPTLRNAFRIGVDGNTAPIPAAAPTLPQPDFPGVNDIEASAAEAMDPHFRPNDIDSFDLTIQRQVGQKGLLEIGYIGRLIHHEYQPINLNAVPYMMSVGGQQFQSAYAALETMLGCATSAGACAAKVPPATLGSGSAATPNPAYTAFINSVAAQPFFEAALKGTGYCTGTMSNQSGVPYASCTAAVLDNELGTGNLQTQAVWALWSDLDNGAFNFPHTMMNNSGQMTSGVANNASIGYGNYNAGFITFGTRDWHGLTMQHNFTWSKALGTGAVVQASSEYTPNDPFNLGAMYGEQNFDRRLVYNTYIVAQEPWFKSQSGLLGRAAGGWQFAPIFTAGSGAPIYCNTWTDAQGWGSGDGANYFDNEQCVFTKPYSAGHSAHYGVMGGTDPYGNSVGTAVAGPGRQAVNMFKDPVAVWNQVRAPILGIDTRNPGLGPFMGLPYWNVDAQVTKTVRIAETASFQFSFITTNLFNHNVMHDASMGLYSPGSWGVLSSQGNVPRKMEFGGRIDF